MAVVRFRIRALMVVVAVVAVGLGGRRFVLSMARWATVCRARAQRHAVEELKFRRYAAAAEQSYAHWLARLEDDGPSSPRWIREDALAYPRWDSAKRIRMAERIEANWEQQKKEYATARAAIVKRAEHHAEMTRRYERCASYPWLVFDEPPAPAFPPKVVNIAVSRHFASAIP